MGNGDRQVGAVVVAPIAGRATLRMGNHGLATSIGLKHPLRAKRGTQPTTLAPVAKDSDASALSMSVLVRRSGGLLRYERYLLVYMRFKS
jgi:hypothetical protein